MMVRIKNRQSEWFSPDGTFSAKFIKDYNDMNWAENQWFDENYGDMVTPEFKTWWMLNYGIPTEYRNNTISNSAYWRNCAVLLEAFNAGVESTRRVMRHD